MNAANEARKRAAQAMLAIGALLLLVGALTNAGWRLLALSLGGVLLAFAGVIFASIAIINGVPWLVRLLSRLSDPVWDGELLHTDGSEYRIPYDFDEQGSPRFIASAICASISVPPPTKNALRWGGVPLLREGKHVYFTEADVQTYLASIATKNRAANRLLLLIRNEVLRKIEKQRENERRYKEEQR
jgi:hypothetical protein